MKRETARGEEMRKMVEEHASSGQTRQKFCSQRGIPVTTFDYWRRELRGRSSGKPRLVRVEVAESEAVSFTLRLANGRAIESSFGFREDELARLIRIAERA